MKIIITVEVKVRFLFKDIYKFKESVSYEPGLPKPNVVRDKVHINKRGVYVHTRIE